MLSGLHVKVKDLTTNLPPGLLSKEMYSVKNARHAGLAGCGLGWIPSQTGNHNGLLPSCKFPFLASHNKTRLAQTPTLHSLSPSIHRHRVRPAGPGPGQDAHAAAAVRHNASARRPLCVPGPEWPAWFARRGVVLPWMLLICGLMLSTCGVEISNAWLAFSSLLRTGAWPLPWKRKRMRGGCPLSGGFLLHLPVSSRCLLSPVEHHHLPTTESRCPWRQVASSCFFRRGWAPALGHWRRHGHGIRWPLNQEQSEAAAEHGTATRRPAAA